MLRATLKGLLLAAMVPAFASAAVISPTVTQGWDSPWVPTVEYTAGTEVAVWLEGSPAVAWAQSGTGTVTDQWGGTHVTTGCTVTGDGTGGGGDAAECWSRGDGWGGAFETNTPNQHGQGSFDSVWKGKSGVNGTADGWSTATISAAGTYAGGAPSAGDTIVMTLPFLEYKEWVLGSDTPVPQGTSYDDNWSDFVITLVWDDDYHSDQIVPDAAAGWLLETATFTAYLTRIAAGAPQDTIMNMTASHYRQPIIDAGFLGTGQLGCAWNDDQWGTAKAPKPCNYFKPGFREAPQVVAGNTFWEACRGTDSAGHTLGACVANEPSAFVPALGYIRAGDNTHAGIPGTFADSLGGFGELAFGHIVPEPGTALLLGAGLIGLASVRRRNS